MLVNLYKEINGNLELVDFGFQSLQRVMKNKVIFGKPEITKVV